jgi:hypothetical protein
MTQTMANADVNVIQRGSHLSAHGNRVNLVYSESVEMFSVVENSFLEYENDVFLVLGYDSKNRTPSGLYDAFNMSKLNKMMFDYNIENYFDSLAKLSRFIQV